MLQFMNMEGTRHEKIVLIIASYVIGFVTAFIAFGIDFFNYQNTTVQNPYVKNLSVAVQQKNTHLQAATIGFSETGFVVKTKNDVQLLSVDKKKVDPEVLSTLDSNAYYAEIVAAEMSPDGRFVFYCQKVTEDSQTCNPFIYVLDAKVLHPVKLNDENYLSSVATHTSSWLPDNNLIVDGHSSVNADIPWHLE